MDVLYLLAIWPKINKLTFVKNVVGLCFVSCGTLKKKKRFIINMVRFSAIKPKINNNAKERKKISFIICKMKYCVEFFIFGFDLFIYCFK
jgi:hypothetical protein